MNRDFDDHLVHLDVSSFLFDTSEAVSAAEKRLLYAICERTVRDLFSSSEEERVSAEEWLDDAEGNEPFSFPWVCEALDLNRIRLLAKIKSLRQIGINAPNASREIYFLIEKNNTEDTRARAA